MILKGMELPNTLSDFTHFFFYCLQLKKLGGFQFKPPIKSHDLQVRRTQQTIVFVRTLVFITVMGDTRFPGSLKLP